MTILIVDDNEMNLYQLQVLLGGNGYQVVTAANGAEALATARQNPPDLIISDILMPVMDGFALCHEWKKDERLRQIPFVFYTATYTDERDREFALSLGAEQFLAKPEEPDVFIRTIREVVQQVQRLPAPPAPPAATTPAHLPVEEPPQEESGYLKQYNEVLIRKLEAKMQQLEQANRELERDITERKRAEAALREAQALTNAIFESTSDMIWTVESESFKLLTFNRSLADYFLRWCGIRLEAGTGPEDHFPSEDLVNRWRGLYQRALSEGSYTTEYNVSAGSNLLQLTFNLLQQDGKVFAISVFGKNITELKRAEQAVRKSEERFRLFMDNSPTVAWMKDEQGHYVYISETYQKQLGVRPEDRLGKTDFEVYPRAIAEQFRRNDQAALSAGRAIEVIEESPNRDGEQRYWLTYKFPFQDATGQFFVAGIGLDITERKRVEAEHVRLVTAIEQSAEAVVITNTGGEIEYVNPAFTRITGYGREEVMGKNPRILKSDKQDPAFYQQLWATILSGQIWKGELINQRKDESLYTEEMNVAPVRDESGKVTHFIATKQDVTEHKTLEEHLRQSAKMEAIGRLAGGVAHDFNNLLTIINGYSELLLEKFGADGQASGYLSEIKNSGLRAASLTRQLLAFSRRQVLEPQVLDLNMVVSNVDKMLKRLIGEDVKLRTVLDPSLWRVKADPGQIEQVIMNLAVNARDAMPSGGYLTLETSNVELDEAYARNHVAVKPGPHVMLAVSDTGVGMTPETKAHIFEPFFTTKAEGKGTGLGLATVYGIVKQSGGSIWVYSELGQGTVFKIYLPTVSEGLAAERVDVDLDAVSGTETILVVEDQEGVRSLIRLALESVGYTVMETDDPESALATCATHDGPIHLLVTDVVMPGLSGPLVAAKVRALRPDIKVLYMSGYTDDAVVHHGVLGHDVPFIQKPFSPGALRKKIREVLGPK